MASHILVAPKYNHYFDVTPEVLKALMESKQYKQTYVSGYEYHLSDESIELQMVGDKDIKDPLEVPSVDIDDILAENNRLTKENELLQEKLNSMSLWYSSSTLL